MKKVSKRITSLALVFAMGLGSMAGCVSAAETETELQEEEYLMAPSLL